MYLNTTVYKLLNRYKRFKIFATNLFDLRPIEVIVEDDIKKILNRNKTILYVGIKYDYGSKNLGLSFEHYNFYLTLLKMDYSIIYFDYDRITQKFGVEKASEMLREAVCYYNPDFLLYLHFKDWIKHEVWSEISKKTKTETIIWLADDHWRYEATRKIWELFSLVVTTDKNGYEKRLNEGFENVFLSQWGCNHYLYRRLNLPVIYDVSFVGRSHEQRREFIYSLRNEGINIETFGPGWENSKRVSQASLISIINKSKICLNLSNSAIGDKIQIKGRDFEVPGCGSLLFTNDSSDISEYFVPGEEIITYQDVNDAALKIKYYLKHEDERKIICKNGYNKVLREHTMEKRFLDLFEHLTKMKQGVK